tara:strand:- start:128 stop:328 length:201 start_codon:yes stop_codon:yes gene_type:complete
LNKSTTLSLLTNPPSGTKNSSKEKEVLKKDSSLDMKSTYQAVVLANTLRKIRNGTIKCSTKKESTK